MDGDSDSAVLNSRAECEWDESMLTCCLVSCVFPPVVREEKWREMVR